MFCFRKPTGTLSHVLPCQAGARVQQVVDALAPHGLTLQNYASISEQQLGGFLQVRTVPKSIALCDKKNTGAVVFC